MSFTEWLAKVDAKLEAKIGLSHDDLPDCPYHDWFRSGMNYAHAANKAIKMAW